MKQSKVRILALDSSSQAGGVALCEDEALVAESCINVRSTHSQTLLAQIDSLLAVANWKLTDLDLLAVVSGPGAFTGLRIGLATIKGLAQVLDLPVVTVSSLRAVALNLPLQELPVCVLLDARKKEVYHQTFCCQGAAPEATCSAQVVAPRRVLESIVGDVVLVGDGVSLYRSLINEILADKAHPAPAYAHQLQASKVAWLALQDYHSGHHIRAENVIPTYIRPSDAELNRKSQ